MSLYIHTTLIRSMTTLEYDHRTGQRSKIWLSGHNTRVQPLFALYTILPKGLCMLKKSGSTGSKVMEVISKTPRMATICAFSKLPSKWKCGKTAVRTEDSSMVKDLAVATRQTRSTRPWCCPRCLYSTTEDNSYRANSYKPLCHKGHSSCQEYTLLFIYNGTATL